MLGKCILLVFVLSTVSSVRVDIETPYDGFNFNSYDNNFLEYKFETNCTMSGLLCKNCDKLVFCQETDEEGVFNEILMEDCSQSTPKKTCFPTKLECSVDYNDVCDTGVDTFEFKCAQAGVFPDPYNCTLYHICTAANAVPVSIGCTKGYSFDPFTLRCSLNTTVTPCKSALSPCKSISQGGLERNSRMYYVCNKDGDYIHPSLYYCPNNQKFIGKLCANPNLPESVVNNVCKEKGLFYVPNCTQYNECTAPNVTPQLRTCTAGTFFNTYLRACTANRC